MSEKQAHSERSKEADKNTSKPPAGRKNHTTSVKSGSNDENSRKKPTVVQPAPKHGRSRGGGSAGGWDSAHPTRHDKHKEHQSITKHQKTRSEGPSRSQTRHRQTQEVKRTSSGGKGPSRNHTHKLTNDRPKDSNNQLTESGGYSTADTISTSSNIDIQDSTVQPSDTETTQDSNDNPQTTKGDDESNDSCEPNQNEDLETNRTVTNRITYDRELLLELKDCTGSLLTPLGLENCVFKEILKTSNRHSGELWDFPHGEAESEEEGRSKHPTSLAFRDHDPKHVSKVSLTPQRRSFGSGCSWREGALTKHGTGSTPLENSKDPIDEDQEDEVFYSQSRTGFPNHAMRKIDHVPYRSRKDSKGDWAEERRGKGANWRNNEETLNDEGDDEPEWMSYGPSDKYELMELKGLEEHELARQKDPDPEEAENPDLAPPDQNKEAGGASVDSPPCLKESELSSGERDSGLPSSSPNEDEFILDGFDFSTGLSICHELESDSDQEVEQKPWLPKAVANEQQLTSALINVLGVGKDAGSAMNQGMHSTKQIKAVTLDEIEEPVTKINDTDQSAFNNLLAVLSPSHKSQVPMLAGHNPVTTSMDPPVSSRTLYMNNMEELVSNNMLHNDHRRSIPPMYQPRSTLDDEHDQKWPITNWSSRPSSSSKPQLLTPSPMMLGMNPHVRHEQPQPGSDWAREMERRRIMELQQMREKERLQMLQQHQHAMLPKKTNTSNIAFMPTSVLRKMPKPAPQVDACMPRPQHGQTSGYEKDYSLHGGMDGGGHGDHHTHPYLPQQHLYMQYPRSNHMGRVDPHMGYTQPHPQLLQQQQIRMGIPTMKHPGYY